MLNNKEFIIIRKYCEDNNLTTEQIKSETFTDKIEKSSNTNINSVKKALENIYRDKISNEIANDIIKTIKEKYNNSTIEIISNFEYIIRIEGIN